jgi:tetratricopeptide (TPR) repeat protein
MEQIISNCWKTSFLSVLFLFAVLSVNAQLVTDEKTQSKLDLKIQAGFTALQAKNWKQAQSSFEEGIKIFEKKPAGSLLVFAKVSMTPSDISITTNGKPVDVSGAVNSFRQVRGTQQALFEFAAFSSQLAGDSKNAEEYVNKVDEMRGVMWGRTWAELIPKIHTIFFSYLSPDTSENFGKYLFMAGELLLRVEDARGIQFVRDAKKNLPYDASIPATLASYLIAHNDPANAKAEAQASLLLNPKQPSVLIDLATSHWLLGELDAASKTARQASELSPDLPGPHGTLAFAALETGNVASALKEAEIGDKLSDGHTFYKTILAVCLEASGDTAKAKKIMSEAWQGSPPDEEKLKAWFFRGKALEYARKLMSSNGKV